MLWVRQHWLKPKQFLDSILWSDESKFNLFGSNGRQIVWRQTNESMKRECLKPTVKCGGGSVMVWDCMAASGVGNLIMTRNTAKTISQWFVKNQINTLKWPAQSPDLNPIEHAWDELERRMKRHSPKNKEELWMILKKEWKGIGRDVTSRLVNSMSKRFQEVMKHHGGPTRY
ncbi:unnamed protein product [Rotaria socialis]|uniref:Tc1-like transposase DDE domain-containing protein n=1 Tax=Rotaria socialis TaxID=392032 RepID=A0A820YY50_9BILA|nr:unnamed protein product [Rotaria socialis]